MATGIIAALTGGSSVTYTPVTDAKVTLACTTNSGNSGAVSVNGVIAYSSPTPSAPINGRVEFYAAAGVPVTITTAAQTNCIASALES